MLKIYLILLAAAVTSATQDKPLAPLERVLVHATEAGYVGRRRGFFDIFDNMLPGTKFRKAIERMNPDAQDVAISLMQKSGKSEQEVVNMIYRMTEDLELRPRGHDTVIFKQRVDKKLKEIEFNKRFGWPGLDACDESEETLKNSRPARIGAADRYTTWSRLFGLTTSTVQKTKRRAATTGPVILEACTPDARGAICRAPPRVVPITTATARGQTAIIRSNTTLAKDCLALTRTQDLECRTSFNGFDKLA